MDSEAHREFLEKTLLSWLDQLIEARRNKEVLIRIEDVSGKSISIETLEVLLKTACSGLPELLKRFDLEDEGFLVDLKGVIENWLKLPFEMPEEKEAFKKGIEVLRPDEILTAYRIAQEIEGKGKETLKTEGSKYKSLAAEYLKRWQEFFAGLEEPVSKDFGLTTEVTKRVLVDTKPEVIEAFEETPPLKHQDGGNILRQKIAQTIKQHNLPVKGERLENFLTGQTDFSRKLKVDFFHQAVAARAKNAAQREGVKQLQVLFIKRAIDAATTWTRLQAPELFEYPIFVHSFRQALQKGDFAQIKNFQEFLKEKIVASAQVSGITEIKGRSVLEIAEAATQPVPTSFPKETEIPPSPTEPPSPAHQKAKKTLEGCLEKNLGSLTEQEISRVSLEFESWAQAEKEVILSLKTDEERKANVSQFLGPLLEEKGTELREERKRVIKNVTQDVLSHLSPSIIEQKGVIAQAVEASFKKNFEDFGFNRESINKLTSGLLKKLRKEEIFNKLLTLKTGEEKVAFLKGLLVSLTKEERIALSEERKKALENVAQEALPSLSPFLSEEKRAIDHLKIGLERAKSPALFFTGILPLPLKPFGLIFDAVSAVSPKVKDALLVGFFGGDKERLKKTRKHYAALLRENMKEEGLAEILGEEASFEQLKKRRSGLNNAYQALSGMEKIIKKPPFFLKPLIGIGNFLRKASLFLSKRFPHPLSIFSKITNLDFSRLLPSFSPSLSANLKTLAAGFLHQHFPNLFIKDAASVSIFKLSLPGLKLTLSDFFLKARDFFTQKIFGSPFLQGFIQTARSFGTAILTKLGLGSLASIGFQGLFKKGLSFGLTALKLGGKLGLKFLSGGTLFLLDVGRSVVNFLRTGISHVFGLGTGTPSQIDGSILAAGGIVAGIIVVGILLPLFTILTTASQFGSWPFHLLQERKILGAVEQKMATPSAMPSINLSSTPEP